MTIHAKNGQPGCISFCFMNFLFSEGGTPPPPKDPLHSGALLWGIVTFNNKCSILFIYEPIFINKVFKYSLRRGLKF